MIKIYTKLDGNLAMWEIESEDTRKIPQMLQDVKNACPNGHRPAILAVVPKIPFKITLKDA